MTDGGIALGMPGSGGREHAHEQPEMVCRFRLDGTILYANGAYARARGTTPERMIGHSFWDFISEADRASVRAMLDALTPAVPEVRIENRFQTADGERWTLWANRGLEFDARGRVLEAQSTGIDITERKRAEESAARSARRMGALYRLTDRLQHAGTPEEIYQAALAAIEQALGCERAAILLHDADGCMRFVAWTGLSASYRGAVEGHSPWRANEPDPKPFGIDDVRAADLPPRIAAALDAEGIEAAAFVPLVSDTGLIGKVMVYYGARHDFGAEELEAALTIGRQVAFGLQRQRAEADRAQANERLRRREQELADFFESAAIGLHWVGADGIILRANRAELDMLGYAAHEYVGHHIAEFHADRALIDGILACLLRGEAVRDHPARVRHKDGSVRDVLINSSALFESGKFVHTRCFTYDVTERMRSEAALVESERRMRLVADNLPALIGYVDRSHRYRFLNARYGEWFGVDPATLSGIHIRDLLGAELYAVRIPYIERVLRGETVRFERITRHHRLGERATDMAYVPDIGRDGEVEGFYVMGFDITERKRTEQTLRVRAGQQRAVAELGKLALREPDLQRVFDYATETVAATLEIEFCKILEALPGGAELLLRAGVGWKPGLVGSLRIGADRDSQAGYALLSDAPVVVTDLAGESRFRDLALLAEHGVASGVSCVITGAGGVPWGVIGAHSTRPTVFSQDDVSFLAAVANTLSDAILRQRAEEALKETDRRKDEFLATLSHELRNPLAPLKNSLHLLRLVGGNAAAAAPVHAMMERQVDHLVRLVDDLLEMSRISRGAFELRPERVELATIVRNAVETSDPIVQRARHRLELDLPPEPLWLHGDPVRLAQILSNLLTNAAKYTPAGGHIRVRATAMAGCAVITVSDNGIGIAPHALTQIFEMFSRGEHPGDAGDSSLGIGLPLARRLAQMHGGSIDAISEGRGRGAQFTVRLPLAGDQTAATTPGRQATRAAGMAHKRVLVVDDNRDAADSLGLLLQALGAEVRVVHDGAQALAAVAEFEPALVLLDIGMPRMDGYEVARRIRSGHSRPPVLVALTGWGQEEDRRRARAAGFDHHLTKPADLDALRQVLDPVRTDDLLDDEAGIQSPGARVEGSGAQDVA